MKARQTYSTRGTRQGYGSNSRNEGSWTSSKGDVIGRYLPSLSGTPVAVSGAPVENPCRYLSRTLVGVSPSQEPCRGTLSPSFIPLRSVSAMCLYQASESPASTIAEVEYPFLIARLWGAHSTDRGHRFSVVSTQARTFGQEACCGSPPSDADGNGGARVALQCA